MSPKVKPIPDGYPVLIPSLTVRGGARAIAFYEAVLGAKTRMRMPGPDGAVMHAELELGGSVLMLADEMPHSTTKAPQAFGGSPVVLSAYVERVDEVFARAVAHGAKVLRPLENQFYGDRTAAFEDPFGHVWSIGTHVEDVSPEEMERRAAALAPPA